MFDRQHPSYYRIIEDGLVRVRAGRLNFDGDLVISPHLTASALANLVYHRRSAIYTNIEGSTDCSAALQHNNNASKSIRAIAYLVVGVDQRARPGGDVSTCIQQKYKN